MNKLILIGNLTKDPQTRSVNTSNGPTSVTSFTVAVNNRRGGQNDATFFNVTAWRQLGDNCAKYLSKGRKVYVSGPVSVRTYQGNDGKTYANLEVTADEVEFLSAKNEQEQDKQASLNVEGRTESAGFTPVETDELPF